MLINGGEGKTNVKFAQDASVYNPGNSNGPRPKDFSRYGSIGNSKVNISKPAVEIQDPIGFGSGISGYRQVFRRNREPY